MQDIYDQERGLKIGLSDDDYVDYQKGNLSEDFFARRKDGSIANRVNISRLDDGDNSNNGQLSDGLDMDSAIKGGLSVIAAGGIICGIICGIKKLLKWCKSKEAKVQAEKQRKSQVNIQATECTQPTIMSTSTELSTETANVDNIKHRVLTKEEEIQELMKIIVGMVEIADGKKKVTEGVENLSNARIVDRGALLEKLYDTKVLEDLNAYLKNNPQYLIQNQSAFENVFGRKFTADGQFVPLALSDIECQLKTRIDTV